MIEITFQAVCKVIVAVLVGAFCCGSVPNTATTMRDFSFLISSVLLPALTVTNTARAVDLQMLVRCSILLFFGVAVIFIGIGSAILMSYLLFGVKKTSTGIPAELYGDVRLELLFDEPAPERPGGAPGEKKKKHKKRKRLGAPYVAVVLSKKMRDMGIDGREVVPEIEIPSVEMEEFPFYYWGAWVACSIQNTVTLPLSLLQNLCESVLWLNFSEGTAYIFVFSIVASLYIWACGPLYVENAQKETEKRRLIREIVTKHKRMADRSDAATQTSISYTTSHDVLQGGALRDSVVLPSRPARARALLQDDCGSPVGRLPNAPDGKGGGPTTPGSPLAETAVAVSPAPTLMSPSSEAVEVGEQTEYQPWSPATAHQFNFPDIGGAETTPYNWEEAGYLRVKYADQLKEVKGPSALSKVASSIKQVGLRLVKNIPFMSIVVGMLIGIIPPIRGLFFDGGVLEMITDAVTLVGQGNIPAALLLLGANLVGSSTASASSAQDVRMRDSEQNTDFPLVTAVAEEAEIDGGDDLHDRSYEEWYNLIHQEIEFDEHASFSLQTILQQQATDRVAAAKAAAAAAKATEETGETEEGGEEAAATAEAGRTSDPVKSPTRKTTDELVADAAAGRLTAPEGGDEEDGKKDDGCMAGAKRALNLDGVKKRFVWGVIVERLLITPALGFLLLIALITFMPFLFGGKGHMDRTMLVVLFMELAAPTAINSALLFNQRNYMTYPWAKMLFFQYILCTITMVMWATIGLEYVIRYVE